MEVALAEIRDRRTLTISTAMDVLSYWRTLEIARGCEFVLPTFGIHPWNAPEYVNRLEEVRETIEPSPMLGEIGLDYHFVEDGSQYPAQRMLLEFSLAAAREQNKIVNLHTTGAEKDILEFLTRYGIRRAIVHWFSGTLDDLRTMATWGVYFTIGVVVLYSDHIRAIAPEIPSAQMLTATDNPVGAKWLTATAGMPCLIEDVVKSLAELRGTTADVIEQTVQANFARLIWGHPRLTGIRRRFFRRPQTGDEGRGGAR